MQAEKYPLDYDLLKKGDLIPPEHVETVVKMSRTSPQYGLKVLAFKQQIESELEARGRPMVLKCEKGGLKVLTDEEARPYTEQQFRQHQHGLRRAHMRTCVIDSSNLSSEDRQRLESQILAQGAKLAALRKVTRKLLASPHKSDIPKIEG